MKRRTALALMASLPFASLARAQSGGDDTQFGTLLDEADTLQSLKAVIVSIDGKVEASRAYHGASLNGSTNIKSASKSIVSALIGMAIDR
jgi:CubicO group peptidase (beta-lactamase class C family)